MILQSNISHYGAIYHTTEQYITLQSNISHYGAIYHNTE